MKLNRAIKILREEYTRAQADVVVRKPMSYALYHVWRYFDRTEKPRTP